VLGMAAPNVPPAAPQATAAMAMVPPPAESDDGDVGEADVLEESDPYDNQGSDFAVGFAGEPEEPTRAGGGPAAHTGGDGWPEQKTVSTYGWGSPAPAPASHAVEADDEATHIGDPTRHD
ncbi:MAG TPA: hypothetical protein VHE35_10145, partial [Kofleriaceae bacterium]|nr:hypothetical protein [Kofleriaceae bacterium]